MLAKENRLKEDRDFEESRLEGKMFQSQNFGASVLNRKNDSPSRFGFVISTKISRLAVSRNRIKRALIEAIRMNLKNIPRGYDFVFLVKKSLADKRVDEIMKEVEAFLNKGEYKN